jgi:hypothetical protein
MKQDYLIDCPLCGEPKGCYAININEQYKSYMCLGCGYQSNDLMTEKMEYNFQLFESQLPQLYIDLKRVDSEGRVWYPSAVNIEDKGTVFANGTSVDNWHWAAIKNKKLTKAEAKKPIFKGKTHKSDPKSLKNFDTDFLSALEYIGVEF